MAVLLPYWDFWERSVPYDLRAEREAILEGVAQRVAGEAEVVVARMVASREDGAAVAREAAALGAQAVLVVQTMAVPPAYADAALAALPDLPLVVWVAHRQARIDPDFDHGGITADGATVGGPMLTSILVRRGRPFGLVVGLLDDAPVGEALREALRAAAVAAGIRAARVGRVGRPLDGYDCVDLDEDRLRAQTGITTVRIEPAEFRDRYLAVDESRVAELTTETRTVCRVLASAEPGLAGSLRAALALEDLCADHRLDAGAFNCHVPEIRLGPEIGLAPCYGLGRMTTAGIPWTCVGDALTAIAMLICTRLGGAAQYHELEALDYETGELVVASSGEHDLNLAPGVRPDLIRNAWFPDDPGKGVCARFSAPPGPATLVALAQIDAPAPTFRLIAARGEFVAREWPATGTANASFRFAAEPAPEAWAGWVRSGANHHSSAARGHLGLAATGFAPHLGIEPVLL